MRGRRYKTAVLGLEAAPGGVRGESCLSKQRILVSCSHQTTVHYPLSIYQYGFYVFCVAVVHKRSDRIVRGRQP